ncbi:MAG: hypothetical protein HQL85_19595 [Magnetococcales bacterium]|nr:hypothetical protein [Magnetococcales bacterium]
MNGGPRLPQSCLARVQPVPRDVEGEKQSGWKNHGILVVSEHDARLNWPERELVKQLGERLYGRRARKEVRHG